MNDEFFQDNNNEIQDTSAFDMPESVSDMPEMPEEPQFVERNIIKVIGIGGGGCNAVNYMYQQNIPLINCVVVNTDQQHLKTLNVADKLLIGYDITHGLGAGNNPEIGRQCAEASAEAIKTLFDGDTEMVFITAGMGGGTGTGAAPVVARLAKEAGMLTIGIVTVPFIFEGEKKILKALDGAKEMQKYVDSLLVINNENLVDIYPDFAFWNCMSKADDTLANAARSISEIISEDAYINVDFQDVRTTLKDSGTAIISTAYGEGEHRITNAIDAALASPLLKRHDIKTTRRLLIKFSCSKDSEKPILANEIREIQAFTTTLPNSVDVKWGVADDPSLGDKVKVTLLASGFDVTLRDEEDSSEGPVIFTTDESSRGGSSKKGSRSAAVEPAAEEQKPKTQSHAMDEIYGRNVTKGMAIDRMKMTCFVMRPEEFDDDEIIAQIERIPTVERDSRMNDEIHKLHTNKVEKPRTPDPIEDDGGNTILFG